MKRIFTLFSFLFAFGNWTSAQVFYQEEFDGTVCAAGSGCDPSLVSWTVTNVGTNGSAANKFYISCQENGNVAGQCGSGCGTDQSLHVGNASNSLAAFIFCPTGDCGAAYDDSSPNEVTNVRAESPTISCVGQSNITVSFVYIETGEALDDDGSFWYFDGTTWTMINQIAKTNNAGCAGQGRWTTLSFSLPASADNNPNVKIGFVWKNDGDGNASDPSFAVDDIKLTSSTTTPPVASFTVSDQTLCVGDCVNFTNTSTGAPFTATNWTFTGAATATSTANNPTNICYNTAGTFAVSLAVTNANGSDTETQTAYITVTTCAVAPIASFSVSDQTICVGDCVDFTNASTGAPFTSANWTFSGAATATSTANNPTNICYNTAGTFDVSLVVTNAAGSDTESQVGYITVSTCTSPPVASFTVNNQSICVGDCVDFTNTSTGGPFTSTTWVFNGAATAGSTANNPTNICYNTAGTFDVSLEVTNANGTDTETQIGYITVTTCTSAPVANFTPSASSLCAGDCITFSNTTTGASSYAWTFPGGTPASSASQNPGVICYNTPGTYTAQLIAANGAGGDTATFTITVGAVPTVVASADTTIDLGNSVVISATGSGSGTYLWTPSTGLTSPSSASTSATPITTTAYVINYTEGGCTVTDTVVITVNITEGIGVPNAFTPDGNGVNDELKVLGEGIVKMNFVVYNRYGQKVFETTDQTLGWDGTHDGKKINGGVFAWYLEYTLVSGANGTLKGNVTLVR